jgi:hypothetical protein
MLPSSKQLPSLFVEGKSILKETNPKNTFLVEVLFRGKVK